MTSTCSRVRRVSTVAIPDRFYLAEPDPNGARINVGAYGNTAEATQSPAEIVQVLSPNGLEKLIVGDSVQIDYRIAGLAQEDPALLMNVGSSTTVSDPLLGTWAGNSYQVVNENEQPLTGSVDVSGVSNPPPQGVYQNYAYISSPVAGERLQWLLPAADGDYLIRLHFAPETTASRIFDINLQGATVLDDYDLVADTGGLAKVATVQEFAVTASGDAGIDLELVHQSGAGPVLSGIELVKMNAGGVASPTVNLELSTDNGASWNLIAANQGVDRFGNGSYSWVATPETVGNTALDPGHCQRRHAAAGRLGRGLPDRQRGQRVLRQ